MKNGFNKKIFYVLLAVLTMSLPYVASAAAPVKNVKTVVPSNGHATNALNLARSIKDKSMTDKAYYLRSCVVSVYQTKHLLNAADLTLVENEILDNVTQDDLDKMLNFNEACKMDYPNGIICPKSVGMNKFYAMYDKSLKKSGRAFAYELFKKTEGEMPLNTRYSPDSVQFITANVTTAADAVRYMNEELYYSVDLLAKIAARDLILAKRNSLIDSGYSVVYTIKNNRRVYSEGSEMLLAYCNRLVDAFNAPYFLGLNARLQEVGCKARFDNKYLLNAREARELSKKVLYGDVNLSNEKVRWMLRVTLGVSDYNALVDRINIGDETLRNAASRSFP